MANGFYRFQVGKMACVVLHEGGGIVPLEDGLKRYKDVDLATFQQVLDEIAYTDSTVVSSMNVLLIDTGTVKILVDTGMGAHSDNTKYGQLNVQLRAAGFTPEDIDIVFITHFHGDHINGLLDDDGNAVYPNARYIAAQAEWEYWMHPETLAAVGEARANSITSKINPLVEQFTTVAAGASIATGVSVVALYGHTPGHSGLLIESDGEALLHAVDSLHHQAQMARTGWHCVFDSSGDDAVSTRHALLERAAQQNLLVMFYHLAFPGLGHVAAVDGSYRWQPIA